MDILAHIKTLLYDYDCVIIPNFGGLLINRRESKILSYKNTITPPSRSVAFNEQLKVNDGLLVSAVGKAYNLDHKEAVKAVQEYVESLIDALEENGVILLEGIGSLSINEDNHLVFEPDTRANFLEDSFGLTEVPILQLENDDFDMKQPPRRPRPAVGRPPVRRVPKPEGASSGNTPPPQKKPEKVKEPKGDGGNSPKNKKAVFILIPVLLLVAAAAISYFGKDKQGNPYLSALIPSLKVNKEAPKVEEEPAVEKETKEEEVVETTIKPDSSSTVADSAAVTTVEDGTETVEEEPAPAPVKVEEKKSVPGTMSYSNGRFHIVAGSFREVSNAEGYKSKMEATSSNVKLLPPGGGSGLYKISVEQYQTLDAALGDIEGLRAKYGSEIWVYEE